MGRVRRDGRPMGGGVVTAWLTRDLAIPRASEAAAPTCSWRSRPRVVLLAFPVAGIVIATRQPANIIGWILLAIGAGWAVLAGATGYADYGIRLHPGSLPGGGLRRRAHAHGVGAAGRAHRDVPAAALPGRPLAGPRWRWVAYVGAASTATCAMTGLLDPGLLNGSVYQKTQNPMGVESLGGVVAVLDYAVVVLAVTMVASAASLVVRFRRAGLVEREQVKWLAAAAGVSAWIYLVDLCICVLAGAGPEPVWRLLIDDTFVLSLGLIPAAIGMAVLRYRLYEIDVIIRRTLVYAALVSVLALLYFAGVYGMQAAVRSVSGQSGTLAVTVVDAARGGGLPAAPELASSGRSTIASIAAATTRPARSRRSAAGCASRSTSRRCQARCWTSSARRCSQRTRRCGSGRRRWGGEARAWSGHGRLRAVRGAVPVCHDVRRSREGCRQEQQLVHRRPLGRNRLSRGGLHLPGRGLASRGSPAREPDRLAPASDRCVVGLQRDGHLCRLHRQAPP